MGPISWTFEDIYYVEGNLDCFMAQNSKTTDGGISERLMEESLHTQVSSSEKWKRNSLGAISEWEGAQVATSSSLQRKATSSVWNATVLI